jgi:hypothetical protein
VGRSPYEGGRALLRVAPDAPPVKRVRTTLLTASLLTVKERGLLDQYLHALPPQHHATVLGVVAGDWVPIEVGMAHYGALDRLNMTAADQFQLGEQVGLRIHKGVLGTAVRLAGASGATPRTALEQLPRLWSRMLDGGGVGLYELGPKDARIEFARCPLIQFGYCRNGFRGIVAGALTPFCRRIFVNEIKELTNNDTLSMHAAWA